MKSGIRQELIELQTLQGIDFVRQLKSIVSRKEFRPLEADPEIYLVGGQDDDDFPRLLDAARKAVAHGYRVYILPNHAFIMDRNGQWKLSPAFDICFAYNPANHWVSRHALSMNFKRECFSIADFMAVAKLINCRKPEAIISEVKNVVSHWADFAGMAHVSEKLNRSIQSSIMVDVID